MRNFFNALHTGFQQSFRDNLGAAFHAGQRGAKPVQRSHACAQDQQGEQGDEAAPVAARHLDLATRWRLSHGQRWRASCGAERSVMGPAWGVKLIGFVLVVHRGLVVL